MALPSMNCPISDKRKMQLNSFWKAKEETEISFLWDARKDELLKEVSGLKILRQLAQYGLPDLKSCRCARLILPDLVGDDITRADLLLKTATSEVDNWNRPITPEAKEAFDRIYKCLNTMEVEIPKLVFRGTRGMYGPVRTVILTEKSIQHIFDAEIVFGKFSATTNTGRRNENFWKTLIYNQVFKLESYYLNNENFNIEAKCTLAEYLLSKLEYFKQHDYVSTIEYFIPGLGQTSEFHSNDRCAIAFILLKTPETDAFETELQSQRVKNYWTKLELDDDIKHSSVLRTLANKPNGKLWMKYFTLSENLATGSSPRSLFYSKAVIENAISYLKSIYNKDWEETVKSPDLVGINIETQNSKTIFYSFLAKTVLFKELTPWLGMIKKTVDSSARVQQLADLARELDDLPSYSQYFINLGFQNNENSEDNWEATFRFWCKFHTPILAVGTRYFSPDGIEFRAYTTDWGSSTSSALGSAHDYFEKMPFLSDVITGISIDIKRLVDAITTIELALNACRLTGIKIEEEVELKQLIWDGLRDYFNTADEKVPADFSLGMIPNPFVA